MVLLLWFNPHPATTIEQSRALTAILTVTHTALFLSASNIMNYDLYNFS
ncbi:MAG TPA: hypothetical protein HPP65_09710 [Gammaproteobacteria bacterium]|nr:hypothetical protein [Gammaproteobacteria bacterium]HIJ34666.1 hypothetical protein [Gammaproteobacteria bacterium]